MEPETSIAMPSNVEMPVSGVFFEKFEIFILIIFY